MVDGLFLLAILAFGLGLSLLTYRPMAIQLGWPMGSAHRERPFVPVLIGLLSLLAASAFAIERGSAEGGWVIAICGLLLAVFWTGFLRVGSQVSLFLAPAAAVALTVGWLGAA